MFRFFRRKKSTPEPEIKPLAIEPTPEPPPEPEADTEPAGFAPTVPSVTARSFADTEPAPVQLPELTPRPKLAAVPVAAPEPEPVADDVPTSSIVLQNNLDVAEMAPPTSAHEPELPPSTEPTLPPADADLPKEEVQPAAAEPRSGWLGRLRSGLRKTGQSITTVFTGKRIDDGLYEDLETALLMADAGVAATEYLLDELKRRVRDTRASEPAQVRALLQDVVADLLAPLEKPLDVGHYHPTVIMVAGVNGAGKTTSIGKLTRHLADAGARVLLAAADTFRAAAREQLLVWAGRNQVEIISQEGADPSAVSFDAVAAGRARDMDVVLVDTAGRLPTQKHLMDELSKIHRVINKADLTAPHEVLLVIDGNTGQNALAQVKAFDAAVRLTGLIVTKLDGSAKGGVLCAIAREKPVPVYFIGVGEQLEDLQTFRAHEFAQALIGD